MSIKLLAQRLLFFLAAASPAVAAAAAPAATENGMRINITTSGYYIEHGEDRLPWFDFSFEQFERPHVTKIATLTTNSGQSYLFAETLEGGNCGYRAYLFTSISNKIIKREFRECIDSWGFILPNVILSQSREVGLCGAGNDRASWSYYPINLVLGDYPDKNIFFEQMDFHRAIEFNEIDLRYQQFFISVLQNSDIKKVSSADELKFCHSLKTDQSLDAKHKLLLKIRPQYHHVDTQIILKQLNTTNTQ